MGADVQTERSPESCTAIKDKNNGQRAEWWSSVLVGALSLVVYLLTMRRGMSGGDSMEFARAACNLSVVHPPGYPLWTMLLNSILRVFEATAARPALLFNITAAVFAALANSLLNQAILALLRQEPLMSPLLRMTSAAIGSLGFAFSPTVWLYANQPEVFALNNAFAAALLVLTVAIFKHPPSPRHLYLAAFMSGVALANQHTIILYIIPIVFALAAYHPDLFMLSHARLVTAAAAAFVGAAPFYAWLRAISLLRHEHSWGDLSSPFSLLRHLLRQAYGSAFRLAANTEPADAIPVRLEVYFRGLLDETAVVWMVLALVGAYWAIMRARSPAARVLLEAYAFYISVFVTLANLPLQDNDLHVGVLARFWMQPNMIGIFVMSGLGFAFIVNNVPVACRHAPRVATTALALETIVIASRWGRLDFHEDGTLDEYGRSMLLGLRSGAILLVNGDLNFNLVTYLQACEGTRPDVRIINLSLMTWSWFVPNQAHNYPGVVFPSGKRFHATDGYTIAQFVEANLPRAPIYMCGSVPRWEDQFHDDEAAYQRFPFGVCSRIFQVDSPPDDIIAQFQVAHASLPQLEPLNARMHGSGSWEFAVRETVWQSKGTLFDQIGPLLGDDAHPDLLAVAVALATDMLHERTFTLGASDIWHMAIVFGLDSRVNIASEGLMWQSILRLLTLEPDHETAAIIASERHNPWRRQPIVEFDEDVLE